MQTTPRIGFWLDNSNQTPQQTVETILNVTVMPNAVYMFCSDGFRHVLTDKEIFDGFNPSIITSIDSMKQNSDYLIDVVKKRNERDNITVALLKSVM